MVDQIVTSPQRLRIFSQVHAKACLGLIAFVLFKFPFNVHDHVFQCNQPITNIEYSSR